MKDYQRADRVGDLLQRELARLIQQELQDPRIQFVTVTAVKMSKDLAYAKVFVTQLYDKPPIKETLQALNSAANFLRKHIAQNAKLRIVPHLRFHHDESIQKGAQLSALIDSVIDKESESE